MQFTTQRLLVRRFTLEDADFVVELVNDPDWLSNIGDRHVHDRQDAQRYLADGPMASYEKHGFGLFMVELRETHEPVGMCGLIRRESLPLVDLGYAFLPRHRGKGYAREAAAAMLDYARDAHHLHTILAIVNPTNLPSRRVLESIGMQFERELLLPGETHPTALYTTVV